jgi:poly-beta-1,6-N-acetyl-D-glucosamine synthase
MAIDADTILAPDGLEKLMAGFTDANTVAACGFVLPRYVRSIWERGRYIEYLFAFTFYKQIQNYYKKPLISSGCFSAYRTEQLKSVGGWSTRTMAEDMDLTWTFYEKGWGVVFCPDALCYPIEPHNFTFMRKQLKRWSHGFFQNVSQHKRTIPHIPYLRAMVPVALWDSVVASFAFLFLLPILALWFQSPWPLLAYVIDAPVVLVPVLVGGIKRREIMKSLASFPAYFVLRVVNALFVIEAFITEWLLGKRLTTYEKGH